MEFKTSLEMLQGIVTELTEGALENRCPELAHKDDVIDNQPYLFTKSIL